VNRLESQYLLAVAGGPFNDLAFFGQRVGPTRYREVVPTFSTRLASFEAKPLRITIVMVFKSHPGPDARQAGAVLASIKNRKKQIDVEFLKLARFRRSQSGEIF